MHSALLRYLLIPCLALQLLATAVSCQTEDSSLSEAMGKGRIVLALSTAEDYTDVNSRAVHPLENIDDYVFTLSGTTAEGENVVDRVLDVADGSALFEAGRYTLHVTGNNAQMEASATGLGTPYFVGSSTSFDLQIGGTTAVNVLLRPVNAKLTLHLSTSFTSRYKSAFFAVGTRAIALISQTDSDTPPTADVDVETYFPAGTLSYTLTAAARAGSHVTDITTTGSVTLSSATNTTLVLAADPVTGEIVPIVAGEHDGAFD